MNTRTYLLVECEIQYGTPKKSQPSYRSSVLKLKPVWDEIHNQSKLKQNDYIYDNIFSLYGDEYGNDIFMGCSNWINSQKRRRVGSNLRSNVKHMNANTFLEYWMMGKMERKTPQLEEAVSAGLNFRIDIFDNRWSDEIYDQSTEIEGQGKS